VGLNVELDPISWKEKLDGRYRRGAFQLSLFLFGGRNSPTLSYGKFIGPKAVFARFQWDDAEALDLVRRAELARDDEALQAVYDELHRRMVEDVPTLPSFNDERFDILRRGITGYAPTRFMRVALWGVRPPD
jgi:peptide/nickel transport system substrate-binding protein